MTTSKISKTQKTWIDKVNPAKVQQPQKNIYPFIYEHKKYNFDVLTHKNFENLSENRDMWKSVKTIKQANRFGQIFYM